MYAVKQITYICGYLVNVNIGGPLYTLEMALKNLKEKIELLLLETIQI
jgi:hypothetical protein